MLHYTENGIFCEFERTQCLRHTASCTFWKAYNTNIVDSQIWLKQHCAITHKNEVFLLTDFLINVCTVDHFVALLQVWSFTDIWLPGSVQQWVPVCWEGSNREDLSLSSHGGLWRRHAITRYCTVVDWRLRTSCWRVCIMDLAHHNLIRLTFNPTD